MFITFEGGEGTGKSTQLRLLADRLRGSGKKVTATREPGGTPEADALRALLVNGDPDRWTPEAEALLNYAARDSHLKQVVRPALSNGNTVLCDRFMDSTRAYQGYAGGCDLGLIDRLEKLIVRDTTPNLTLVFDLDPELGLARAKLRGDTAHDRFERKGLAFHQKLRAGFLTIAKADQARCKIIDASLSLEQVTAQIWKIVNG